MSRQAGPCRSCRTLGVFVWDMVNVECSSVAEAVRRFVWHGGAFGQCPCDARQGLSPCRGLSVLRQPAHGLSTVTGHGQRSLETLSLRLLVLAVSRARGTSSSALSRLTGRSTVLPNPSLQRTAFGGR